MHALQPSDMFRCETQALVKSVHYKTFEKFFNRTGETSRRKDAPQWGLLLTREPDEDSDGVAGRSAHHLSHERRVCDDASLTADLVIFLCLPPPHSLSSPPRFPGCRLPASLLHSRPYRFPPSFAPQHIFPPSFTPLYRVPPSFTPPHRFPPSFTP